MYVNIIHTYRDVIAIADKELLGKVFEEGDKQLNVKESFYKGEIMSPEETEKVMEIWKSEDATFNLVGEKTIQLAIEKGLIHEESVKTIQGIPYSLILL